MTLALTCARCGAPLPLDAVRAPFASCAYCETTLAIQGSAVSVTGSAPNAPGTRAPSASQDFSRDVADAIGRGVDAFEAVREASARHLGVAGQSEAVARVTIAIARDFERESGASIARDVSALCRITEAYLRAIDELRQSSSTEMNLPFLAATSEGPKHYRRTLDPAVIARLAMEEPPRAAAASPPGAPGTKEKPKKKGWWPFGA
ncbi:MAG: hypothetical protein IT379_02620 [Deltaproteobacteria bacterium]|nr:hypothetical protein [Deltaproteobacteria bacterium]